ncbi:uncharacterized protein [Sinocyclocheilus grahami]|uniref:uncharacterized protein n=1 Tax=Sinocyclocheilus grahami TaxID=75366 RepID=UPI0007AC968D|nr:PREDICTED: uncharacterized protein LOC107560532 [Sinocyclocheilus grahami]
MMPSENLDCGYHVNGMRHRQNSLDRRNRPDGMDQNDSYPSRMCSTLGRNHSLTTHMHWEELCSCGSSTLQSSENLSKSPISHCELYTLDADNLDYPSPVVRLIPPRGASGVSREPGMDIAHLGAPPSSGLYHYWPDHQAAHFTEQTEQCPLTVRTSFSPPFFEHQPSELESRLELLQSQLSRLETTQPDSIFKSNSQGSLSSGVHMGAASDDCVPDKLETNTVSTPVLQPILIGAPRLCASLRFPSLPGNLDTSSHLEEIPKYTSDPALPVS